MQKWFPEPFDARPVATAPPGAQERFAALDDAQRDEGARLFRRESGFTDTKSLMASLTRDERAQVYELVEMASGLGTSGLFVLVIVALVPGSPGGKWTAAATMLTGLAVYVAGEIFGLFGTPYVFSLIASVVVYGVGAALEKGPPAAPAPLAEGTT